jgi:hypothetical protein
MEGKYSCGQYLLTQTLENKANAVGKENLEFIHARLGHLNLSSIRQLMDLSTGLRINKGETLGFCRPCVVAKAHRHYATTLIAALYAERELSNASERPIIFICHGFGGILVKRAQHEPIQTC